MAPQFLSLILQNFQVRQPQAAFCHDAGKLLQQGNLILRPGLGPRAVQCQGAPKKRDIDDGLDLGRHVRHQRIGPIGPVGRRSRLHGLFDRRGQFSRPVHLDPALGINSVVDPFTGLSIHQIDATGVERHPLAHFLP